MSPPPYELPGLSVRLDQLIHQMDPNLPAETPHAFVYFLTIENHSDREVTLLGRKWVVEQADGEKLVIEGDGIVGERPKLAPGESFSYNSFHVTGQDALAYGSFHGVDSSACPIFVRIPAFEMKIPVAK
jgi:ApaG protein